MLSRRDTTSSKLLLCQVPAMALVSMSDAILRIFVIRSPLVGEVNSVQQITDGHDRDTEVAIVYPKVPGGTGTEDWSAFVKIDTTSYRCRFRKSYLLTLVWLDVL